MVGDAGCDGEGVGRVAGVGAGETDAQAVARKQ